tara:strand:- start:1089 stop:1574 length:486 start_codon:yes stop_codon:yes gene_type:complete
MKLKKIISGAQTGADIAGIKAAKDAGLETGGWIPRGFITQAGPKPEYAELYNITEHSSDKYPPRTFANAKDSEATVRFAGNWGSPGERCTLKAIEQYNRPHMDVDFGDYTKVDEVREFVSQFEVVNIAGNSERTCRDIEDFVYRFMFEVLKGCDTKQNLPT